MVARSRWRHLSVLLAGAALCQSGWPTAAAAGASLLAPGYSDRGTSILQVTAEKIVAERAYPGIVTLLARHGKVLAFDAYGRNDISCADSSMKKDTIFEIASMTKPVIGVAMMILYEEGRWTPKDPIAKYIPQFAHLKVYGVNSTTGRMLLENPIHPPTIGELLSNTAGFTYGWFGSTPSIKCI